MTGKAGAGKTHYGERLCEELISSGIEAILLDSDEIRRKLDNDDFSYSGRENHLLYMAGLASSLERNGVVVIIAAIAPLKLWRYRMRSMWNASRLVYLPGGSMWKNTVYEMPDFGELR